MIEIEEAQIGKVIYHRIAAEGKEALAIPCMNIRTRRKPGF